MPFPLTTKVGQSPSPVLLPIVGIIYSLILVDERGREWYLISLMSTKAEQAPS